MIIIFLCLVLFIFVCFLLRTVIIFILRLVQHVNVKKKGFYDTLAIYININMSEKPPLNIRKIFLSY